MGPRREVFEPLLHNTVTPTMLSAGTKINVIPGEASLLIHARLLPGYGPDDLRLELRRLLGPEAEMELSDYEPGPPEPDIGLFPLLGDILRRLDPQGTPVPFLMTAITDARLFAQLGIQTYGFTPMPLPPGMEFWRLTHGADERVPVQALEFGTQAILSLLERYGRE
jgi:acetylornithine deacetylase/succinyl-diaminopimelate desuccinylase-like protein